MFPYGYVLMVRDYKAEIVRFDTLEVMELPDGSNKYRVMTKFGEAYFNESELSPIKAKFVEECNKLNEALSRGKR